MPDIQPPVVDNSPRPQAARPELKSYSDITPVEGGPTVAKPLSIMAYGFIAAMLVTVLGCGGFYLYQYILNKNISNMTSDNNTKKTELKTAKYVQAEKTLAGLKAGVENFNKVIAAQQDYSQMFSIIGKATYIRAKFNSFAYSNKDGKISISGATDTYTDLGNFLRPFTQLSTIKNFTLGTFSGGGSDGKKAAVQFSVSFTFPNVKSATTASNTTTTTTTTTTQTTEGGQ